VEKLMPFDEILR